MPKYLKIAKELEREIIEGKYSVNGKLPTEEELQKRFNVSRNTIRGAINNLTAKGVVIAIQGSGIFVREGATDQTVVNLEYFLGLTQQFRDHDVTTKLVHSVTKQAKEFDLDLMTKLKCEPEDIIYNITRLRYVDGEPYVIETNYFLQKEVGELSKETIETSIFSYLKSQGKEIGYVDMAISADTLDEENSILLGLAKGKPTLKTENISLFKNGRPFAFSVDLHHYKKASFIKLSNYQK